MNAKTDSHADETASGFEAEGDDQVVQYGTPSALAIVSLLLGLAAPLCFAAPLLMAIPIFGAVLALVALRNIATSEGMLIGRRAAIIGLALCVVSGVAVVSRNQVLQHLRFEQAKVVVQQWVELIQAGQLEPAFRLTYRGASPEAATPPSMPGEPVDTVDPLQRFSEDPVIAAIRATGENARVRWIEDLAFIPQPRGACIVQQRYEVVPAAGTESKEPVDLMMNLQLGQAGGAAASRWLIGSHAFAESSAMSPSAE